MGYRRAIEIWAICWAALAGGKGYGADAEWNGYSKRSFEIGGRGSFVVEPKVAAPGKPWVWRTSFPEYHAEVDLELLHNGYHVGYIDCVEMLGSDGALDLMDAFYGHVREEWGLAERAALEAVSRGGLPAYRYAARHPERVAAIYADVPVMDLKSWPAGVAGAEKDLEAAMRHYGFEDGAALREFRGNPLDLLGEIAKAKVPLRHVVALDDAVVRAEENTLEARRRLRELGHDMEVVVVEKGKPEQGGHHFDLPDVYGSVQFVMRHAAVLPAGREYFELRRGLARSREAFEKRKVGRVAFLGGSITQGGGWRDEVMRYLRQRFAGTEFEFVAAGISSMGSVAHAFRLRRDVLEGGAVDLLFVEAAVNDATNVPEHPELMLRGMEGVVRQMREANPMADIVQMHFAMPGFTSEYGKGRVPVAVVQHEKVAAYYGCVSLDLAREVAERIGAGEFTWEGDFRDLHPSPYGHRVYANSMMRMLEAGFLSEEETEAHEVPEPMLDAKSYAGGHFGQILDAVELDGFEVVKSWEPRDGKGTREGYVKVPALVADRAGAGFRYEFEGEGIGLLITSGPDAGVIEFSIDGGAVREVDTFTRWSGGLHLPWALVLDDGLEWGRHSLEVRTTGKAQGRSALRVFQFLVNGKH